MTEISEKQVKRLRSLVAEAETSLAAAKELMQSILGDEETTRHTSKSAQYRENKLLDH